MHFSREGFVAILLVLSPNILLSVFPPQNMPETLRDGGLVVSILEHGSRILYIGALVLATKKQAVNYRGPYLPGMALCLAIYTLLWARYLWTGYSYTLLFESVAGILLPMAVFPVIYMLLTALWLNNIPAAVLSILFAIGHVVNSYITYKQIL